MVKRVIFILILVSGPTWGGEQPVVVTGALGGGLSFQPETMPM